MTKNIVEQEQKQLDTTIQIMIKRAERLEYVPDHGDLDDEREPGIHNVGADAHTSLMIRRDNKNEADLISEHIDSPYFGRMDVKAGGKVQALYLGMHSFYDPATQCRVTDWRAPIAALFQQDDTRFGKSEILLKRKIDIKKRKVKKVTTLYGEEESNPQQARENALVERLGEKSGTQMGHVVPTIQPEQDLLIRAPMNQSLLVQGPAGSGKTSVAFHRTAWLTFGEQGLKPEEILMLVPNDVMRNYSGKIIEELSLQGLRVSTPARLLAQMVGFAEQLKITDYTLDVVLSGASQKEKQHVWIRAKALGDSNMPQWCAQYLLYTIEQQFKNKRWQGPVSKEEIQQALEKVREEVNTGERIDIRAGLESQLRRKYGEEESVKTVARLLGNWAPSVVVRRMLEDPQGLAQACGQLKSSVILAMTLPEPKPPRAPREAHADQVTLPVMAAACMALGQLRPIKAKYLLIDEAHDLSPLTYRILKQVAPKGHISAFGDINQSIHGYRGISSWNQAADALGESNVPIKRLERAYRSTRQITDLSVQVASTYSKDPSLLPKVIARDGEPVRWWNPGELPEAVKDIQSRGLSNIAILVRSGITQCLELAQTLQDAQIAAKALTEERQRYSGGVVVMPVSLAKGLEFDAAILADAQVSAYPPELEYERRLLYVAISRGMHELHLIGEPKHPTLYPLQLQNP